MVGTHTSVPLQTSVVIASSRGSFRILRSKRNRRTEERERERKRRGRDPFLLVASRTWKRRMRKHSAPRQCRHVYASARVRVRTCMRALRLCVCVCARGKGRERETRESSQERLVRSTCTSCAREQTRGRVDACVRTCARYESIAVSDERVPRKRATWEISLSLSPSLGECEKNPRMLFIRNGDNELQSIGTARVSSPTNDDI